MIKPLVSIIVPVYNVEKYLEKCVNSLIDQTYQNLEIILVDDGSKDSSGILCDRFANQDKRIKVIHKPNEGLSSARKAGIDALTGEYVMIVDGDDWIDEDTVSSCVQKIVEYPNVQCVLFSYIKEYQRNSIPIHVLDKTEHFGKRLVVEKIYRRLFGLFSEELNHPERMNNIESCCMKLYEASIIRKGKFFDTKEVGSSEDALFNIYALFDLEEAYYIDKNFYHYRKVAESITNSYRPQLVEQWGKLFDIIENIIVEKKLGKDYMLALNNRIALSICGIGMNELSNPNEKMFGHIRNIRKYINSPRYIRAVRQLELRRMPITWKVFMLSCKGRLSVCVYAILVVMTYLKKRG